MNPAKTKSLITELIPLLLAFVLQIYIHSELGLTLLIIVLLAGTWYISYTKREWLVFLMGLIIGLLFEVGDGLIYRSQFWQQDTLWGVPLWLPVLWGYGFVFIRRIGNTIIK